MADMDYFNQLAADEEAKRRALTAQQQQQITGYANDYQNQAGTFRTQLANNLLNSSQQTFQQENPYILQDLNARGLSSSPTEVGHAQSQALGELALKNNDYLNQYDQSTFNTLAGLHQTALAAGLQGGQDALDSSMDLRRQGLERQFAVADQARQEALANALAKRQQRSSLIGSLIGAGSSLGSAALLGGLFGGGGTTTALGGGSQAATSLVGAGPGSTLLGGGGAAGGGIGLGTLGLGALGYGAAIGGGSGLGQVLGKAVFRSDKARTGSRRGAQVGSLAGAATLGPAGALIGGLGGAAVGGAGHSISVNAKNVVKHVFCFDGSTPVTMADNSERAIREIVLGDKTQGGEVESVRISVTPDKTLFNYNGVLVTGSHAVKENGKWTRVDDSDTAVQLPDGCVVYSLVTSDHRIWVKGIEFADEHEIDEYESVTMDESLEELNRRELAGVL